MILDEGRHRWRNCVEQVAFGSTSCLVRIFLNVCCNMQGVAIGWATFWTPQPLGYDAPAHVFSEGRAMDTVKKLSEDIGIRLVRVVCRNNLTDSSMSDHSGARHSVLLRCGWT